MSLPKTNKQTKIPWLPSLKGHDNHTLSFHSNTTNHNPSKDETFCSIIHFSTTLSLKKKKDTKCFVEGFSEQTVEREKWRECSPDHLGLSKVLNGHGISENKSKTSTYLGHGFTQSNSHSSFFFNFLFWRKKSWKRGVIRTTTTTKWNSSPMLRLTREVSCPLWSLVSLYEPVCASQWRNSYFT